MEPTSRRSLLQSLVAAPAVALLSPSREASASVLELPKPIVLPPLENALESHDCVAHFCLPFDREEYDRVWPVSDGLRAHVWVKDRADLSINARFRSVICGISSTPNIFRPIEVRVLCKDGSLWGSKEGRLQHLEPGELLIRRGILTGTSGTPFCMDSVEVLRGGLFDVGSALRDVEKVCSASSYFRS